MQPGRRFDQRAVRTRAIHERAKPASARSSPSKAGVTFGLSANNHNGTGVSARRTGTSSQRSDGQTRGYIANFCRARDDRQQTGLEDADRTSWLGRQGDGWTLGIRGQSTFESQPLRSKAGRPKR